MGGSRFTALNVAAGGEAFLLETEQDGRPFSVLVDGGKSADRLCLALSRQAPEVERIDVVICTHQDADHAGGLADFADQWLRSGGTLGQYWLPGSWSVALPELLTDPRAVASRIESGARSLSEKLGSGQPPRFLADLGTGLDWDDSDNNYLWSNIGAKVFGEESRGDLEWFERLGLSGDARALALAPMVEPPWYVLRPTARIVTRDSQVDELRRQALDASRSILAIAASAARHRIPVHWFDFQPFAKTGSTSGGLAGLLAPMNAREHARPRAVASDERYMLALALTKWNVECLVFLRPETSTEPGVLFLGDSRLAFGETRPAGDFPQARAMPTRRFLVTAPHHGSANNDHAFDVLGRWIAGGGVSRRPLDVPFFIRNGGTWNQTLGKSFLSRRNRRCASCLQCAKEGLRDLEVDVQIASSQGEWVLPPAAPACPAR